MRRCVGLKKDWLIIFAILSYPARIRIPSFFRGKTRARPKSGAKSGALAAVSQVRFFRAASVSKSFWVPRPQYLFVEDSLGAGPHEVTPLSIPNGLEPVIKVWPLLPAKIQEAIKSIASIEH